MKNPSLHTGWASSLPTFRVFLPGHQRQDSLSVIVGLLFTRSSRIFPIIGQFINATQVTDGVTRNNVISFISHNWVGKKASSLNIK